MNDDDLQFVPIYTFNRAHLFMGGDRLLVMLCGGLCLILLILQNLYTAGLGVILFFVMLKVTQAMAKSDPDLRLVYLRYTQYQAYYPAHSVKYLHKSSVSNAR